VDPGIYGPLDPDTTFGTCQEIHGLSVCLSANDSYGLLAVAVHLPRTARPVAVEIGLAGTGLTARMILLSLRVA